jgi:hypothetical protein
MAAELGERLEAAMSRRRADAERSIFFSKTERVFV